METVSEKPNGRGFMRIVRAGVCSWQGFKAAWRHEAAFRQEALLAIVLIPLGLWLGQGGVERALLAGSVLLVPIAELLNSAIETVVDRIGMERHELSGRAKDMGSAVVFLACSLTVMTWCCVLFG
ncbi:MAG: diacylglycerol kinase [Ottowia sp.]|nr:diacylglycerol kinase [Ottowia sp.]MBR6975657.1 diacylglycerol kinase [Ottowia sp.]